MPPRIRPAFTAPASVLLRRSHAVPLHRACRPSPLPSRAPSRSARMTAAAAASSPSAPPIPTGVRVRFAPSPTGALHVGGARTALYNWLAARQAAGSFVVRVEDTDVARSTRASEEMVLSDLTWLGLHADEGPGVGGPAGPYRQSERAAIYAQYAEGLLASGRAYRCFCTEGELEAKRAEAEAAGRPPQYDGTWRDADAERVQKKLDEGATYTVRFRVPAGARVEIDDAVRGKVAWDAEATVGDFILLRSTGVPVYNFCVAVDDALMGVSTVIRAEEHLTNTLRQVLILRALGFSPPAYAHCSLILGSDRSKLSKRHGATSVTQFREEGYLPAAMVNYLATLGWNDGTEQEIYSVEELIDRFDIRRITKSPAMFDGDKLRFINGQHLRKLPREELTPMLVREWVKDGVLTERVEGSPALAGAAAELVQGALELVNDGNKELRAAFAFPLRETLASGEAEELVGEDGGFVTIGEAVLAAFDDGSLPVGDAGDEHPAVWKKWVKALGKATGRKGKRLFHPLRLALTGKMSGPDVGAILRVMHLTTELNASEHLVPLSDRIDLLRSEVARLK